MSTALTQEEIPEEGGWKKFLCTTKCNFTLFTETLSVVDNDKKMNLSYKKIIFATLNYFKFKPAILTILLDLSKIWLLYHC